MKDGSKIYQVERPDEARAEAKEAFSTPVLYDHKGKTQLLVTGGDCITGHDPETGKEIWRWGTWNPDKIGHWRLVPSPVAGNGIALACAPKGAPIYAVKLGGNGKLDDSHIAWKSTNANVSSDVPTPLFYRGHFYVAHNGRKRSHTSSPTTAKSPLWLPEKNSSHCIRLAWGPVATGGFAVQSHWQTALHLSAPTKNSSASENSLANKQSGATRIILQKSF